MATVYSLRLPRFRSLEVFSFCVHFWMAVHATIYFSFSASNLSSILQGNVENFWPWLLRGFPHQPSLLSCRSMCVRPVGTGDTGDWTLGLVHVASVPPLNHVLGIFFFSVLKQGLSWNFLCSSSCPWICNPLLLQPLRDLRGQNRPCFGVY